jgi:prevent-host-death family protein
MKSTTFSGLRNNAKKYFDAVERGEEVQVFRRGKPIAIICPVEKQPKGRWKTANPIKINSVSLSKVLLAQRNED